MRRLKANCVFISMMLSTANTFGWHDAGHMMVAEIAYKNLDKKILPQVDNLISHNAQEYPKNATFVTASAWADDIIGHGIDFFNNWHFEDQYVSLDGTPLPKRMNGISTRMLAKSVKLLSSDRTTQSEKAFALKMIIHVVGDMHQPLHNISRVSKSHPLGDRGGNLYKIKGQYKNLHSLWDSGLGHLPIIKRPLDQQQTDVLNSAVDEVTAAHPLASFSDDIIAATFDAWQQEGYDLASKHAYTNIPMNTQPNAIYLHNNAEIAKKRIALAGYRLSNVLNCVWGSQICIQNVNFQFD